jgi:hypothetical protein
VIPKGSNIFPNVWGIMHDENLFERPDDFYPERFVESHLGLRKDIEKFDAESFGRLSSLTFGSGRVSKGLPGYQGSTDDMHLSVPAQAQILPNKH